MKLPTLLLAALLVGAAISAGCTGLGTMSRSAEDQAFAKAVITSIEEIGPIREDTANALLNDNADRASELLAKLAARANFWHDTIEGMPVSPDLENAKRAYLLVLEEYEGAGEDGAAGMQLSDSGEYSASTARLQEAIIHLQKAGEYLQTTYDQLPDA